MPKWIDLKIFCEKDGWELYKETNRYYYRKIMPDGSVKRTKILMDNSKINPYMWKEILAKQLQVTQIYFDENIR
ncbi:MAG TPA: type II toxin-antitoxin system HicA family toxin [Syntrophomonadaceae bacterium]|nr:type II toxin-antitoxin system HicA family toxin [Syntrophomonadaceae bacterium]